MLNDKKLEPSLIDPQAGVRLVVPALEQVEFCAEWLARGGQDLLDGVLQQSRRVKRGDRVNIVIGQFHANGLVVD